MAGSNLLADAIRVFPDDRLAGFVRGLPDRVLVDLAAIYGQREVHGSAEPRMPSQAEPMHPAGVAPRRLGRAVAEPSAKAMASKPTVTILGLFKPGMKMSRKEIVSSVGMGGIEVVKRGLTDCVKHGSLVRVGRGRESKYMMPDISEAGTVMALFGPGEKLSRSAVAAKVTFPMWRIERALRQLVGSGRLIREGKAQKSTYSLPSKPAS